MDTIHTQASDTCENLIKLGNNITKLVEVFSQHNDSIHAANAFSLQARKVLIDLTNVAVGLTQIKELAQKNNTPSTNVNDETLTQRD